MYKIRTENFAGQDLSLDKEIISVGIPVLNTDPVVAKTHNSIAYFPHKCWEPIEIVTTNTVIAPICLQLKRQMEFFETEEGLAVVPGYQFKLIIEIDGEEQWTLEDCFICHVDFDFGEENEVKIQLSFNSATKLDIDQQTDTKT